MTGPVQNFFNQNRSTLGARTESCTRSIPPEPPSTSITVGNGQQLSVELLTLRWWTESTVSSMPSAARRHGGTGVLVQAKVDFSSSVAVPIGNGGQCNVHAPTVNNAYFTSPVSANSLIYIGGVTGTVGPCTAGGATGGTNQLYAATFGAGGVLTAGAPAHALGQRQHGRQRICAFGRVLQHRHRNRYDFCCGPSQQHPRIQQPLHLQFHRWMECHTDYLRPHWSGH